MVPGPKHGKVAGKPPLGGARGEGGAAPGKRLVQLAENRNPRPVLETLRCGGDAECFREIPAHDLWGQREVLPLVVVAENFEAAAERGGAGLRPADAENLAPAHCGLVIVGDCQTGLFRSPTMILANDSIKPEGGVRCKTGLDWRVILGVLAACWIF